MQKQGLLRTQAGATPLGAGPVLFWKLVLYCADGAGLLFTDQPVEGLFLFSSSADHCGGKDRMTGVLYPGILNPEVERERGDMTCQEVKA